MTHTISEADRSTICKALAEKNNGAWKNLVSEIDDDRNEIFIWLLLNRPDDIRKATEILFQILPPFVKGMDSVSFFVTLFEKDEASKIAWEMYENTDLLAGYPSRILGANPDVRPLADFDVFGENSITGE